MYTEIINEIVSFAYGDIVKVVFSASKSDVKKATLKPVLIKQNKAWQCERIVNNQAFHENIPEQELGACLERLFSEHQFKQVNIIAAHTTVSYRVSKKGETFRTEAALAEQKADLRHDREKQYLLADGMPIKPLVDLGVFDQDFHIVKAKRDKFRQINKFVEIIDHSFKGYKGGGLTIIDFGCGKSYLTFIVYYYFAFIRGLDVKITGYDLKGDVVAHCNSVAEKYGYANLSFVEGDITKIGSSEGKVDMIITLHACDTATDYALYFAIKNKVPHIFSVPCCQHEVNAQIGCRDEYALLLRHGLYKERFSAILTDCVRCEALSNMGYDVDVVDFVDFSNTPKNAMIRAKLTGQKPREPEDEAMQKLLAHFGVSHTLLKLLADDEHVQ